jgi:predicted secreted Zn-dependent protease
MRKVNWSYILILGWFLVTTVRADIEHKETFTYYDIRPQSASAIIFELRKHSPVRKNRLVFYGNTEVEFRPLFRWKKIGKLCYVQDFIVNVNTEYTMPRLSEDQSFDQLTRIKFDKFYDALLIHEKGHGELGIKAANDIHHLLENAKPVQGCKVLEKRLKRDINNVIYSYKKQHKAYDTSTNHGGTQGAIIN